MEEWVIRGAIAVIAAISGAIVRPWLQDWLARQRWHRLEQRAMADEWLGMMSWRMLIPASAIVAIERGRSPRDAAREVNRLMVEWIGKQPKPTYSLAPGRLSDSKLREMFEELTEVTNRMIQGTSRVARTGESDGYLSMLRTSADKVEELRNLANRRIGELQL